MDKEKGMWDSDRQLHESGRRLKDIIGQSDFPLNWHYMATLDRDDLFTNENVNNHDTYSDIINKTDIKSGNQLIINLKKM